MNFFHKIKLWLWINFEILFNNFDYIKISFFKNNLCNSIKYDYNNIRLSETSLFLINKSLLNRVKQFFFDFYYNNLNHQQKELNNLKIEIYLNILRNLQEFIKKYIENNYDGTRINIKLKENLDQIELLNTEIYKLDECKILLKIFIIFNDTFKIINTCHSNIKKNNNKNDFNTFLISLNNNDETNKSVDENYENTIYDLISNEFNTVNNKEYILF